MESTEETGGDGTRVVIQRRRSDRPFRVVDGQQPLTGWVKTWEYAADVAQQAGWSGEVVPVSGDDATDPPLTTKGGYPLDEAVSAVQKAIRRADEVTAAFFAFEMARSGFHRYIWRRLAVIAAEDVGLANPDAAAHVLSLWQLHERCTEKRPKAITQFLGQAVLVLCRSPKSRTVDRFTWWVDGYVDRTMLDAETLDAAEDMHTRAGRERGRGIEHFLDVSGVLVNEVDSGGEEYRAVEDRWREDW